MDSNGRPPVPDPSVLTTEQLLREVAQAKDLVAAQMVGLERAVAEKFKSVDNQLALVEQQRVEQKADTKAAVDAALTAQKEAVREQTIASERSIAKSEVAITKQLESMAATFTSAINAATLALNDTKDRVGAIEARRDGVNETVDRSQLSAGLIVSVAGLVLFFISVAVSIIVLTGK